MVGSLSMEASDINNENNVHGKAEHQIVANGASAPLVAAAGDGHYNDVQLNATSSPVAAGPIGCDNDSRVDHDPVRAPSPVNCENGNRTSAESRVQFCESAEDVPRVQFQEIKDDVHHVQFHDSSDDEDHADDNYCVSFPSSSSSEDGDSDQFSESRAPDGGWGWVVVFASFMVNLIADGVTFSFGVIYLEFVKYFGEGKSKTAWIGSLFAAIPLLSGPFASYLTDRYGCRKVSIAGGILAALGFVISAFIDSIEMLFFTFGILSGFGLSLCYVAAIVIVAYYFEKKRSFATGLSVCGSGIGTFIFPPFMDFLISEYGWRGTTLILAGLFLNLCVCGALMRDLEYTKKKNKDRKLSNGRHNRTRVRTNTASSMDSSSQYSQYHTPSVPSAEEFKRLLQIAGTYDICFCQENFMNFV